MERTAALRVRQGTGGDMTVGMVKLRVALVKSVVVEAECHVIT